MGLHGLSSNVERDRPGIADDQLLPALAVVAPPQDPACPVGVTRVPHRGPPQEKQSFDRAFGEETFALDRFAQTLSRLKQGFNSPMERQQNQRLMGFSAFGLEFFFNFSPIARLW
jgi:hypothetical protein